MCRVHIQGEGALGGGIDFDPERCQNPDLAKKLIQYATRRRTGPYRVATGLRGLHSEHERLGSAHKTPPDWAKRLRMTMDDIPTSSTISVPAKIVGADAGSAIDNRLNVSDRVQVYSSRCRLSTTFSAPAVTSTSTPTQARFVRRGFDASLVKVT